MNKIQLPLEAWLWSAVTCHRFFSCDLSQKTAASSGREAKAVTGHRTPKGYR